MSEANVSDQAIHLVTRFFPEWIEFAETYIADLFSKKISDQSEVLFAICITHAFREQKGVIYESVEDKHKEVSDYLVAVNDQELSDEEIRWQLKDKLGGGV